MIPLPFDPALAREVRTNSLEPHQRATAPNFKTATDFYAQVMSKHPYLSEFHSRAELLHAGLLEGDPDVISYTPQPFMLWLRGRRYTPDNYVVRTGQPRQVVELKPRGEMPEADRIPLTHFFAQHGVEFIVVSNESVYAREIEAENWLEIVRILHLARDLDTTAIEHRLLEALQQNSGCQLGDLLDPGEREHTYLQEIALFRLLHRGHVTATLVDKPLNLDTGFTLCV